ncbi:MAG: 2-phosphosulfolactate phosphatase [Planctomycetota bacterium]
MIHAVLLTRDADADWLAYKTVVVIDVLRATSVIAAALHGGARAVHTFADVNAARHFPSTQDHPDRWLRCGERQCHRISDFDLGNSPGDYVPAAVGGMSLAMTTTNGTRAFQAASRCDRLLAGSFVNYSATLRALTSASEIVFWCAGTNGVETLEDILFAGAMVHGLVCQHDQSVANQTEPHHLNDGAKLVLDFWRNRLGNRAAGDVPRDELASELADGLGGRNLIAAGMRADLDHCAAVDRHPVCVGRRAGGPKESIVLGIEHAAGD